MEDHEEPPGPVQLVRDHEQRVGPPPHRVQTRHADDDADAPRQQAVEVRDVPRGRLGAAGAGEELGRPVRHARRPVARAQGLVADLFHSTLEAPDQEVEGDVQRRQDQCGSPQNAVEGHRGLVAEAYSSKRWRELLCRHAQPRHGHHGIPAELVGVPLERVVALRPIVMPRPDRFPARAGGEDVQRHDANAHEREREEADAARAVGDAGKARALVPRRPVPQRVAVGRRAQGGRGDERRGHHCPLEVPERLVVVDPRRLPPGEPRADLYCARGGDEGRGGFAAVVLHHSVLGGSCDCGCCVALSISVAVNICAVHRAAS